MPKKKIAFFFESGMATTATGGGIAASVASPPRGGAATAADIAGFVCGVTLESAMIRKGLGTKSLFLILVHGNHAEAGNGQEHS